MRHDDMLLVSLFTRPPVKVFDSMSDNHWFVLTAIAQHGELRAREIATIVNLEVGFCTLALNFFAERKLVVENPTTGRMRLTPLFFRQVLKRLGNQNFLYG